MGAAGGAAEEHGTGPFAEVGQELLALGCVVPTGHAQVLPKLVEGLGMGCQFAVSDLADEGGRVAAVDEPVVAEGGRSVLTGAVCSQGRL